MIQHDYRCLKCGEWREVLWDSFASFQRQVECSCGGVAVHGWRRAPGLAGVSEPSTRGVRRTFHPGYDVQAGRHFDTRTERDRYVKGRGLEALGPEEYKRTMNASVEPEIKLEGIRDAMKEAYEEAGSSRDVAPLPSVDSTNVVIAGEK